MSCTIGDVLYEKSGAVATVTLNRPDRRNALGGTLREDIVTAMEQANASNGVRVIVLTGAGASFCAGGDLKEMSEAVNSADGRSVREKLSPQRNRTLLSVYESPKPVIASINGPALGAGMNLALAADLRIASMTAQFGQPFVRRGFPPDYAGSFLLPRIVGQTQAAELILTVRLIDAEEALRIGIVGSLARSDGLRAATLAIAHAVCEGAPVAVHLAKQLLAKGVDGIIHDALDRETAANQICYDTDDVREGLRAFVTKRPPVFTGK